MRTLAICCAFILVANSCSSGGPSQPPDPVPSIPPPGNGDVSLQLVQVAAGLSSPVALSSPAGDSRLFILELPGRIRIVQGGQLLATPFLDITAKVASGGERGLLSIAFHPDYASNGRFYVNYTGLNGETRIERYNVSATGANTADAGSVQLLLTVDQPYPNHNGGQIAFGLDGKLYVGMGDGGGGGDPLGHGQNRNTLLGAMLRIDVDAGTPYTIPAGNPFIGQGGARGEIWAYGLRNPWRFSFDHATSRLYIADVGQNRREEINVVSAHMAGLDYGWNITEGSECFTIATCDKSGQTLPVLEYDHSQGCSVTGGYVYRGQLIPEIAGHYFYSDFCAGWIRSFSFDNGQVSNSQSWNLPNVGFVLAFGQDAAGELYVLTGPGVVYKLARAAP